MARQKTSPVGDLFEIAALLPWWAGVGIAVVAYFVCHSFATAGDYTTPTCASCGVKMIVRTPKAGGKAFWGCVNYPRCTMIIYTAGA